MRIVLLLFLLISPALSMNENNNETSLRDCNVLGFCNPTESEHDCAERLSKEYYEHIKNNIKCSYQVLEIMRFYEPHGGGILITDHLPMYSDSYVFWRFQPRGLGKIARSCRNGWRSSCYQFVKNYEKWHENNRKQQIECIKNIKK